MSWATATSTEARFKSSLVTRARKRTVEGPLPGNYYLVHGNPSLSDAHDRYLVQLDTDEPTCSCQSHEHGQYRPVCSHGVAALLHAEAQGEKFVPAGCMCQDMTVCHPDDCPVHGMDPRFRQVPDSTPQAGEAGPAAASPGLPPAEPQGAPTVDGSPTPGPPAPGVLPHPGDRAWGQPGLPSWVEEIPPHQERAVLEIEDAFDRGAKVVVLSAPTGTGKTLLGELTRRRLGTPAVYSATTKTLQRQVLDDFDYARVLQGRSNYATQLYPERFTDSSWNLSCEDCNWTRAKPSCTWCESKAQCPYEQAKEEALAADLAVVNTAYFLAECNGPGKLRARGLAILDEADMLESQLMGHAEVRVSKKWQQRLGIEHPSIVTHTAKSAIPTWRQWAEEAKLQATEARSKYTDHDEDPTAVRERRFLDSLRQGLTMLEQGLSDDESPKWVYTDPGDGTIVFRPVRVSQLGGSVLWGHADRFLLMSASVISADEMMDSLGFTGHWEHVEVPSTFEPERRPVYACPVADVTSKGYDSAVPQLQQSLSRIAAHHPADNILVHSVSYKLARDLADSPSIPHEVISYTSAKGRNKALERFRKAGRPAMIVAPSLDRGVDLPDDACRVVVVAKVPYPYLGDRQVHARLYSPGGQTWYRVQTVRSIVQMTGRAMRHKDDSSVSYILDRQFMNLWRKAGHLFPGWWTEAMRWEYPSCLGGG